MIIYNTILAKKTTIIFTQHVIYKTYTRAYCLHVGGAMASWLVRSTPDRVCCVIGQNTLLSRCLSPPRCINGYRRI